MERKEPMGHEEKQLPAPPREFQDEEELKKNGHEESQLHLNLMVWESEEQEQPEESPDSLLWAPWRTVARSRHNCKDTKSSAPHSLLLVVWRKELGPHHRLLPLQYPYRRQ